MSTADTLPLDSDEGSRGGGHLVERTFVPNEIELFMYCAATWNTHRIHYDRDYARLEGYRDLVVPGPMQSARLGQMLAEFATVRDGRLTAMSVRHHAMLYCNEPVSLQADHVSTGSTDGCPSLELTVAAVDAAGAVATSGAATIVLAAGVDVTELLRSVAGGSP